MWLAKDAGGQRPMGEPTCEDTMVHRAVAMRWEARDEQDVQDRAAGFWRGRSPHAARHARRARGMTEGLGWSVEAEVRGDCASRDQTR